MTEAGIGVILAEAIPERERASATPLGASATRRAAGRTHTDAAQQPAACDGTLASQQQWFSRAIMTPESQDTPFGAIEADCVLTAGPRLSALDRLEVYRRAYHARLVECLADDYPALQQALGPEAFEALARLYIERHPSTGPNLNAYGRAMPAFCRDPNVLPEGTTTFSDAPSILTDGSSVSGAPHTSGAPLTLTEAATALAGLPRVFAADLAALEWALVEVIHAASAKPLTIGELSHVPMDRWADARLRPTPAFRLLRSEFPVNAYLQALRAGEQPTVPLAAPSAVVVYRCGATLWRMNLTEPMVLLLESLTSGQSLLASIERAAESMSDLAEEQAASRVMIWFRDWVSSGLFCQVDFA